MGTKRNPGEFDCYAAADLDEPMFIMLGRDGSAAGRVRSWARRYWWRKIFPIEWRYFIWYEREGDAGLLDRQYRKYREALQCALQMDAWWLRKELDKQVAARRYAQRRAVAWFMLPWW